MKVIILNELGVHDLAELIEQSPDFGNGVMLRRLIIMLAEKGILDENNVSDLLGPGWQVHFASDDDEIF